jgi:hypothetical protein
MNKFQVKEVELNKDKLFEKEKYFKFLPLKGWAGFREQEIKAI